MSVCIDPGEFDQRLQFQRRAPGKNTVGQANGDWVDAFPECWGSAEPLRGREFFAAGQMQQEGSVRFRVRYRTDVDAAMRVVWRGLAHAISAPPIDVKGLWVVLVVMCRSGVRVGD